MKINIGLDAAIFLVFLVMKLMGYIAWSWWWVTSPLWIPIVALAIIGIIALLIIGAVACFK